MYYDQLSGGYQKVKTSFVSLDWSKARANKIGINISIFIKTGSNPLEVNWF